MNIFLRQFGKYVSILISLTILTISQASAQGNSEGKGHGKNKNVGVGNASDGISAKIVTAKDIFYTGDPLAINLQFNRGADLVTSGEVDAYVVIFAPAADDGSVSTDPAVDDSTDSTVTDTQSALGALGDAVVLPVSSQASSDERQLFAIQAVDVSALPPGTYQLGLILTKPGGDPLLINDWFKGLLGLVNVVGLTISDEALSFDVDGDGEVDDDSDGDGFSDEVEDNSTDSSDL